MKSFFWKLLLCFVPVAIACGIIADASFSDFGGTEPYYRSFKWGVDLRGGTILVYEIDTRKLEDKQKEEAAKKKGGDAGTEKTVDFFKRTASELADALRKRIDPTATKDIKVRPAGSEGRLEIILPTGGAEQARKAEEAWQMLVKKLQAKYKVKVNAPRGQIGLLVERIQTEKSQEVWQRQLLKNEAAWKRLMDQIDKRWVSLSLEDPKAAKGTAMDQLRKVPVGQIKDLSVQLAGFVGETKGRIDSWLKQRGWEELIHQIAGWPDLHAAIEKHVKKNQKKKSSEELKTLVQAELDSLKTSLLLIPADSFEELIGRIETRGNVIGQAVLDTLEPLLGRPPGVTVLMPRKKLEAFITKTYGPSPSSIMESIVLDESLKGTGKDLTAEGVQRIKDLVARVGALQFFILANEVDDKQAIKAMQDFINQADTDPKIKEELLKAAVNGLPPPGPRDPLTKKLTRFELKLPRRNKSWVTYTWLELGKQERKQLGFSNSAQQDPNSDRREIWARMNAARNKGQAIQIIQPRTQSKKLTQGALFYSREIKDRNLPEKERREKKYEYFVLARNPEFVDRIGRPDRNGKQFPITGKYLARAYEDLHTGRPQVGFYFYPAGADLFGTLTSKNVPSGEGSEESRVKRHLAIVLDGLVMSAPTINSTIRESGVITGDFTMKEVQSLVTILRSGALPATLKPEPVSESTIGALLGRDTIIAGAYAIVFALILVLVFMVLYYRFAGLVACIALFSNLALTIGFMVFVQATFTLPGLAGLVLMLGMAVDSMVLIFERIREERNRGAALALSIRNGYERAFPTIIDTHLTSIFTAIVLYAVGNDQLKGFGISLTVGLIISLFTSLFMTRVIIEFWLSRGWLWKLSMFPYLNNYLSTHPVNFMKYRHIVFPASVGITVIGLAIFLARMPQDLGIDFKGGTAFSAQLTEPVTIQDMRASLSENPAKFLGSPKAKQIGDDDRMYRIEYEQPGPTKKSRFYTVTFANRPKGSTKELREADVADRAKGLRDWSVEMLYPTKQLNDMKKEIDEAKKARSSDYVSPFFTVRTSEMERELVQVILNQVMQSKKADGSYQSQIKQSQLEPVDDSKLDPKGSTVTLLFNAPASPSYTKSLFLRELRREFADDIDKETGKLPIRFQLEGEGSPDESGRFQSMTVTFDEIESTPKKSKGELIKSIKLALSNARDAFNDRPQPLRLENFDSQLAADTRLSALGAIFASWLMIVLYLWFRFGNWTFGLAAVLCLVHDLCFTLGLVAISAYVQATPIGPLLMIEDFTIDFTGVAALLTLVGYSVNDTIVVFDRIREVRGKNPELTPQIINDSINQTLSRTLITSITTFVVVFVLFILGGPGIHVFAFIMCAGVLIGTLSSIFVACPLLLILGEGKVVEKVHPHRRPQAATAEA